MSLDQFVDFQISVNNSGVPRAGFGGIGVLSYKNLFSGRSKAYSRTADMITDGFDEKDVEVRIVSRIMAQTPHPPTVSILRGILPPTLAYLIGVTDLGGEPAVGATEYNAAVKGEGFANTDVTYTSAVDDTEAHVHYSWVTQLNAVTDKNYTAAYAALVYANQDFTADNTTEVFTKNAHGLKTGDGPFQVSNSGGALPAGLTALTDYWVIAIDANTFYLAESLADAIEGTHLSITTNGTGTQTIADTASTKRPSDPFTVTANAAGDWFSIEIEDVDLVSTEMTHADPGIATDLDAIVKKDNTWYYLETLFNSKDCVLAAAEWVEANNKVYTPAVYESETCTVAVGDTPGDTMYELFGLGYKRTMPQYHFSPADFLDGGLDGLLAPKNVGLWTAKGKTPVGVRACPLTPEHTANILARKGNSITFEGGRNVTWEGQLSNADYGFFDVTVSLDWVTDAVVKAIFGAQVSLDKVAYTDEDISVIEAAVNGVILEAVSPAHKIMAPGNPDDPDDLPPSITFPRVADIDPSVRALRELPDGQLSFRLQGAVHKVRVNATVSF